MNENEKRVIVVAIVVFVVMQTYPPFHLVLANGAVLNMGYSWIFDAPKHGDMTATVNVFMLVVQWLGVLVIGGLAFFMVKNSAANVRIPVHSATHSAVDSATHSGVILPGQSERSDARFSG